MPHIINTEKITDQKWLNLYKRTYTTDQGTAPWYFVSRRDGRAVGTANVVDAVVIVPILMPRNTREHTKLVLIKEYRVAIGDYEWQFPAGLLEPGESFQTCIERELKEETGYNLSKIKFVSGPLPSSAGLTDETCVMAFVECTRGGKQKLEPTENIEAVPVDTKGLSRLLKDNSKIISAKAWPILLMFNTIGDFYLGGIRL